MHLIGDFENQILLHSIWKYNLKYVPDLPKGGTPEVTMYIRCRNLRSLLGSPTGAALSVACSIYRDGLSATQQTTTTVLIDIVIDYIFHIDISNRANQD